LVSESIFMNGSDSIGKQFGNYRLLRLLGEGAFAEVYLAEHRYLEVPAAIKVLRVQIDLAAQEAFLQEARLIARLQHPHIVRVLDFGFEGQTPYLIMEFIANGTLRTLYPRGTRLSLEQIIDYTNQIASALDYAHEQHVIHRDVKPENLLLNAKGEIVLSDFGIAVVQRTLNTLSIQDTQNMAGTPLYMAPEQIMHHPCPASDQYALGVIVYEWLCGKPPFPGPGIAVFAQHLYQTPPSLYTLMPQLSPGVEDTVLGALAKNPVQRFATVQDFAIALEEACFATQILPVSKPVKAALPERRATTSDTLPIPVVSMQRRSAASPLQPAQPGPHTSVAVMSVCAPADWQYLEQWEAQLHLLEQAGVLTLWSERHLLAGASRQQLISEHLNRADLIILLLSADFFSSEDCITLMKWALQRQQNSAVRVVPLLLRPVEWQASPLAPLQCMPSNQLPITAWPNRDMAFNACVRDLRHLLGLPMTSTQLSRHAPASSAQNHNRRILLRKVRSFWVTGMLEHSLHGAAVIALGLREQPEAVANPWHLVLQQFDMVPRPLPAGMHIRDVYDKANGELLILGAPGSGKTTLLLELARNLLERAERDEQEPIPVVFTLSSWATKQQRLVDWFVEELVSKYQVPRKLGKALIEADCLLPLLDGLDEVAPRERTACIEAINIYRLEHGMVSLVVSSRHADYLAQTARVQLSCAVVIQPLQEQQIDDYLARGGAATAALHHALRQNRELLDLARTPLMLSILTLSYYNMPVAELLRPASSAVRSRLVFERYVERMLRRSSTETPYSIKQTMHWLSWLAQCMKQRNQTVFYIERMQPDWLEIPFLCRRYPRIATGLIFGLIGALWLGPIAGLLFVLPHNSGNWPVFILSAVFGSGISLGLPNGLLSWQTKGERWIGRKRGVWKQFGRWLKRTGRWSVRGVLNGLLVGLIIGLPAGQDLLYTHQIRTTSDLIMIAAILGCSGGFAFFLIDAILDRDITEIRPTEIFTWSWTNMLRNLIKLGCLGLLGTLLLGLLVGLFSGLYGLAVNRVGSISSILPEILKTGLTITQSIALFVALISGILGALTGGPSSDMLDTRNIAVPNQGMRRSAFYSILIGSIGIVVSGILFGLLGKINNASAPQLMLIYWLIFGPLIGLVSGLRGGGIACIQHMVLRWLLWAKGFLPWNCTRFLDYASECMLLRKVGGGYIFVHRLLLEYFASLEQHDRQD
jgi:serine/threonine protein kinase/DNA polymerase III delta prime subunit